ncbi:BTAD domain-containing putative transcriptional regulator [Pseudonocardia sp. RS010]|uniref:BTAD domain-containing putative transcriptional regulator n=1 Tax=Pseudonocardia sp. RS010 TaxID=3385979 RepID=UPI0039A16181
MEQRRPAPSARVEVRLLGGFGVSRDGVAVPPTAFGGRQARLLTRILATRPDRPVSRDELAEILWAACPPADPAANLNVLVHRARRALGGEDVLRRTAAGYLLVTGDGCEIDAECVLRAVAEGRALLDAGQAGAALRSLDDGLRRWAGEPLPEDADAGWAREYRRRLVRSRQEALILATEAGLQLGRVRRALDTADRAAAAEALDEPAHRLLARARMAAGDRAGALRVLDDLRARLVEELGVDPTEATRSLRVQLLRDRGPAAGRPPQDARLPFVGRAGELAELLALSRTGGVAVVAGGAGAGKSRLLAELASRVGPPVLSARAFPAERRTPWALAATLLRSATALRPEVPAGLPPRIRAALADLLPELPPPPDLRLEPRTRRALLLEGALRLLTAATAGGATVLVDDLQWADASSVHLLALATQRLHGPLVVLAHRPEELTTGSPVAALLAELGSAVGPRETVLGPLCRGDLIELGLPGRLADVLAEQTDGSPFALAEVLTALETEGRVRRDRGGRWSPSSAEAPDRARQLAREGRRRSLLARVQRQDPGARTLLVLLALLGRHTPAGLLADAAGRPERAVLADLECLARAALVRVEAGGWLVQHDLISETVVDELPPADRAGLHGRVAAALGPHPSPPGERARHLVGAGDPAAAATALVTDAREQLGRHADAEAAQLATAALDLRPPDPVVAELLDVRAEARARAGELVEARADLRAALAVGASSPQRARLLARLAMLSLGADDPRHASELVELALVSAGTDAGARAAALAVAAVVDMNLHREERAASRAEAARRLYLGLGDAHGVADVLDARAMAGFLGGGIRTGITRFREVVRLYTDLGDLHRAVTPWSTRAHALLFADDPAAALADSDRSVELARELGAIEAETYALWHRSEVLTGCGRPREALADAEHARETAERLAHRGWTATALRARGLALRSAGDLEAAEAAFRDSLATARGLPLFTCWAHAQLALTLTDRGRFDDAADQVAAALVAGPPLGRYEARLARARLALARGDDDADAVCRDVVRLARAGGHGMTEQQLRSA